jgi:hypothetical protein
MRSTTRGTSAQAHLSYPSTERQYVATSGIDPVEYGLTLDWIIPRLLEICRTTGDDLALWLIEAGESPRLVAAVRPAPSASAVVTYL